MTSKLIQSLKDEKNFTINRPHIRQSYIYPSNESLFTQENVSITKLWLSVIKSMFNIILLDSKDHVHFDIFRKVGQFTLLCTLIALLT